MPLCALLIDRTAVPSGSDPIARRTIAELVTGAPGAAALLRSYGVDVAASAPGETLAAAAAARDLPLEPIVAALDRRAQAVRSAMPEGPGALIDFILERYHGRHRAELPGLIALAAEVEATARGRPDAPEGLAELLDGLRAGLEEHMIKEELRVFPLMRAGRGDLLAGALALMRDEHEDNAPSLLRAAQLTGGFRPPADATPEWRRLCADLARFADDLVAHVYIEESVLFPRFEAAAAAGQPTARPQRS